jgi:hypothetical protein
MLPITTAKETLGVIQLLRPLVGNFYSLREDLSLLPHGCTHWLATGGLLRDGRTLLRRRPALPFCPKLFHRRRDTLTACRAHPVTLLDLRCRSLTRLGRTTTPCGLSEVAMEYWRNKLKCCDYLPTSPLIRVLMMLGNLYLEKGDTESARRYYFRAFGSGPVDYVDEEGVEKELRRRVVEKLSSLS